MITAQSPALFQHLWKAKLSHRWAEVLAGHADQSALPTDCGYTAAMSDRAEDSRHVDEPAVFRGLPALPGRWREAAAALAALPGMIAARVVRGRGWPFV